TTNSSTLTLTLASGGIVYYGDTVLVADQGVATFDNVHIPITGTYTVQIAANGLTSGVSSSFAVAAGPASSLTMQQGPTTTAAGPSDSTAGVINGFNVVVEDQYGNVITSDDSSTVTLALASGVGTLLGTLTAVPVDGVATFLNLGIHEAGTYTMGASDGGLTG